MLQPTLFPIVNFIYLILINFMQNVISQITLTPFHFTIVGSVVCVKLQSVKLRGS